MQPARESRPIRVVVADANLMSCGLLSAALKRRSQFEVVGEAISVDRLLQLVENAAPEVALISHAFGGGTVSGVFALAEIHEKYPKTRLILLIDRSEPELVVQAFRAGARGIFDARFESNFARLCKCILRVHQGQFWTHTSHMEFIVNALMQVPSLRVVDTAGANLLTKREEDLLRLVAEGLGNRDIAQQLNLSENTVKNYMFRIFEKLGISNRVELVLYALNNSKRPPMPVPADESPTAEDRAPKVADTSSPGSRRRSKRDYLET
jgi:DNA-binding NarL/FixJ family response regulator